MSRYRLQTLLYNNTQQSNSRTVRGTRVWWQQAEKFTTIGRGDEICKYLFHTNLTYHDTLQELTEQTQIQLTYSSTKRSQHSQECKNPRWHCFCGLWPRPLIFSLQINWTFYVKFDYPSCSGFWDIMLINRQKDAQTNAGETPTPPLPSAYG